MTQATSGGLGAAYTNAPSTPPMKTFERRLPTEEQDYSEILQGILLAQKRYAPKATPDKLGRGTHTKGFCVRGTFEVRDLTAVISDPTLRAKLARGLFALPGRYPAVVRFANARSYVASDAKRDVRAISFEITVPRGVLGDKEVRLHYSANSTPVFAINDAHAFALFMRFRTNGFFSAISTMRPPEIGAFFATTFRGALQLSQPRRAYQYLRYWSNVAFRHGADEAIKYSLTGRPENPTGNPAVGPDMLRKDVLDQVSAGQKLAFDFSLQLLDAERMTRWGRKHDEIYWVENASVEWPEEQAPFHTVASLTIDGPALSAEETENFYIDVNEHSTPESHPLGSINRARWYGETASRTARLKLGNPLAIDPMAMSRSGEPLPPTAGPRARWLDFVTLRMLLKGGALAAIAVAVAFMAFTIGMMTMVQSQVGMLPVETLTSVKYAAQGFGPGLQDPDRQAFYYTPQGAGLKDLRYSWFINLEMPWGTQKISDPAIMRRYGFLVDDSITPRNRHQLPVGFTKHYDTRLNEELLDVTCATCHTGQLEVSRGSVKRALRIDGGQANHAFTDANIGEFLFTLISSMAATQMNPLKFNRFAKNVLGPTYPQGKYELRKAMFGVTMNFANLALVEKKLGLAPTQEGYGRTDALARISNTVFGETLGVDSNYHVGNAPVSFPPVWNIWKFDWVQYNASVSQPMARNIGEAMGVGARYVLADQYGRPLPPEQRFRSSALLDSLYLIENTIWKLKPPAWDEDILGRINRPRADSGRALFNQNCVSCHGPHIAPAAVKVMNSPGKSASEPEWLVASFCANDIGTDPLAAGNFAGAFVDISKTGLTSDDLRRAAEVNWLPWGERKKTYLRGEITRLRTRRDSAGYRDSLERALAGVDDYVHDQVANIDPKRIPVGAALSYLGVIIRQKAYDDQGLSDTARARMNGFGRLDVPQIMDGYKSRPLAGIWATPPYLHNGSVPTIYDLLSPPGERPKTFQVGSREFDTGKVGLKVTNGVKGYLTYDVSETGNANTGHEFAADYKPGSHEQRKGVIGPALTPAQRLQIIEYLKIRDDDADGPKVPSIPHSCSPRM